MLTVLAQGQPQGRAPVAGSSVGGELVTPWFFISIFCMTTVIKRVWSLQRRTAVQKNRVPAILHPTPPERPYHVRGQYGAGGDTRGGGLSAAEQGEGGVEGLRPGAHPGGGLVPGEFRSFARAPQKPVGQALN